MESTNIKDLQNIQFSIYFKSTRVYDDEEIFNIELFNDIQDELVSKFRVIKNDANVLQFTGIINKLNTYIKNGYIYSAPNSIKTVEYPEFGLTNILKIRSYTIRINFDIINVWHVILSDNQLICFDVMGADINNLLFNKTEKIYLLSYLTGNYI